jgi:hypothetical protein
MAQGTGRAGQTEIDALAALRPDVLDHIAREAIRPFYDADLDRRIETVRRQWSRDANEWLHSLPQYAEAVRVLTEEHGAAARAFSEFEAHRRDVIRDLSRVFRARPDAPGAPPDVPIDISAIAPEPLFSTDDDHVTASRKLINHKALADLAGDGLP